MGAMVVRADGRLMHPGHESRAAWGTNRRCGEEPRVTDTLSGEPVEVRRPNLLRAITPKLRPEVFGNEPEDVWPAGIGGEQGSGGKQERNDGRQSALKGFHGGEIYQTNVARPMFFCPRNANDV